MSGTNHSSKRISYKKKLHSTKSKKGVNDYIFYVGTTKQASDYKICAEFPTNYIKRTVDKGNDIAEILGTLTKIETDTWKLQLKISTNTDKVQTERKNKHYETEYKGLLDKTITTKTHI